MSSRAYEGLSLNDLIVYGLLGFGVYMFMTRPAASGPGVTEIPTNEPSQLDIPQNMVQPVTVTPQVTNPFASAMPTPAPPGVVASTADLPLPMQLFGMMTESDYSEGGWTYGS